MSVDWNAPTPVVVEGVSQEANAPASPSDTVDVADNSQPVTEESQITEPEAASEPETQGTEPDASQQPEQEFRLPKELRDAYDGTKGLREIAKQVGGEEAVKEAVSLHSALASPDVNAKDRLKAIYQAAPRAYEDIQKELFFSYWDNPAQQDALDRERFGKSTAEIKELLAARGQVAPSSTPQTQPTAPTADELATMTNEEVEERFRQIQTQGVIPPEVQEKLNRLEQLENEFPQLKSQVSSFAEQQEAARAEKVTALGQEFLNEAMSPVVRMMEEAGLKVLPDDTPEEKAWKEREWKNVVRDVHDELFLSSANKPLADDIETFITKLDKSSAWSKMRLAQAKAEMAAAKVLSIATAQRQKQRESQTSNLGKDHPPVITGGQSSLGSTQTQPTGRDAWNDPSEAERWKDIASSVGV